MYATVENRSDKRKVKVFMLEYTAERSGYIEGAGISVREL